MNSGSDKMLKLDILLSVIDWLTFNAVLILCCLLHIWPFYHDSTQFLADLAVSNMAYIVALQFFMITLHHRKAQPATILNNTSRTALTYAVLNAALLGMLHMTVPGLFRSLCMAFIIFIFTTIERMLLHRYIKNHRSRMGNRVNTVLLGTGGVSQEVVNHMLDPWNGYNLLGYFTCGGQSTLVNKATGEKIPCLGHQDDFTHYAENHRVDELYIGIPPSQISRLQELLVTCENKMIRLFFIPELKYKGIRKMRIRDFGEVYVMAQYNEPLRDVRNRFKKRAFDIAVSLLFLCTLFPIITLIVAIVSKITMPGPLFFKQKRTGYDGRDFLCYKFRSMKVNKDSDKVQATKNDPRITKWGSFMRHANIDELPQFINVLKGDMSLVGPRPHMLAHTDYYSSLISDYMIRHYVKPGITGWAQTHGERGETKTVQDMERRVVKDIWYIEHWSFWLDIQIMMKTVSDAIHGDEKAF